MSKHHPGIILGAGLAGLGAAVETGYPIFEAGLRLGGTAGTVVKEGFAFDVGIHIMQSKDIVFQELMQQFGVTFASHHRNAWIYNARKYAAYPFQVNTSNLTWQNRFRCVAGFLGRRKNETPENYGEWIYQNFGKGFAELFMFPYAEKFWRTSPFEMSYEWAGQRVPQPKTLDVIKGAFVNLKTDLGTNPVFSYPSAQGAGFTAIAEGFLPHVSDIHFNARAVSLCVDSGLIEFEKEHESVTFDKLITTIPLPELVRMLKNRPPHILEAARSLTCNSIAVVNLGIEGKLPKEWHWAHFPAKDISFFRISFPHTFADGLAPHGTSAIQAEVSYDSTAPPERDALINQVRADLVRVGVLDTDAPVVFSDVIYQEYGYVIYNKRRDEAVRALHDFFHQHGIFPCGRYGSWEYLWSDEAIMDGKKNAQLALSCAPVTRRPRT